MYFGAADQRSRSLTLICVKSFALFSLSLFLKVYTSGFDNLFVLLLDGYGLVDQMN